MQEILKKSAIEQSNAILNKEISATELVKATLERINSIDEKLGAYNSITSDIALNTAKQVDEKFVPCRVKVSYWLFTASVAFVRSGTPKIV